MRAKSLARHDLDALAVDGHGQNIGARLLNGGLHAIPGVWLDQKDHTATATGSADFACQSAVAAGVVDDPVNGLRGNGGQVSLAEGPFLAHQAAGFGPVRFFESKAHLLSNFGNTLEAVLHGALAADMRLEDFPVVDTMLARLAGVTDHDTALEFVEIDAQFDAMLTTGREFYGRGATECRRVVILSSGGNTDDDGFRVAADVDPVDLALPCSGEAVERGANGHGHGAGAANACACRSFRIGGKREAALGVEKFGDFREEREAVALCFYEDGEGGKTFFALDVAGNQLDAVVAAGMRFDDAGGVKRNRGVHGDRAGMK